MSCLDNIKKYCDEYNIKFAVGTSEDLDNGYLFEDIPQPFYSVSKEEKLSPKLTMHNAKSIIILAVPFLPEDSEQIGECSYGSYDDYHIYVKKHLDNISQFLDGDTVQKVDGNRLNERILALTYGLGFKGLNGFVINDELGTYFNIGYILTELELKPTSKLNKICINCKKCESQCPTNALEDGICDSYKCVSYLTQKKGLLEIDEIKSIGNFLYGCHICQKICPHNNHIERKQDTNQLNAFDILKMSKKNFVKYSDKAFSWRGLGIIKRNAIYNIYNSDLDDNRKKEIFEKQLSIETMELPKKALCQVLNLL